MMEIHNQYQQQRDIEEQARINDSGNAKSREFDRIRILEKRNELSVLSLFALDCSIHFAFQLVTNKSAR